MNKLTKIALLLFSLFFGAVTTVNAQNNSMSLNGKWKAVWHDGNHGIREMPLFKTFDPKKDMDRYVDVEVPSDLNLQMQKLGMFGDLNYGTNTLAAGWVARQYWQYYRTFNVPKEALNKTAWLVFKELDYHAEIYLNGKLAGGHKNAFVPYRMDATKFLKEGNNEIVVIIESGLYESAEKPGEIYNDMIQLLLNKRHWLRKPQYTFSWDWNPNMINVGITGDVTLEWKASPRLDQIAASVNMNNELTEGEVEIRPFIHGVKDMSTVTVEATIVETNQKVTVKDTLSNCKRAFTLKMKVDKPKLWWPIGQGDPNLYTLKVDVKENGQIIDTKTKRIGFRKIEVDRTKKQGIGNYFTVTVNNRKIFMKGGNWVPADMIHSSVTKERTKKLIDLAVEENFNILRVWGGGLWAGNDMLDMCDERGLLIWHDFLFACTEYPGDDLEFYNNVKREITWGVREFSTHPSLVIWAGNNENEAGTVKWGWTKSGKVVPDYIIYHHLIPSIIKAECSSVFYWPSSPFSENHEDPESPYFGDQHPWDVALGKDEHDFYQYRNYVSTFADEGGFLGASSPKTLRQFLPKDQQFVRSISWEHHDNLVNFWSQKDLTYVAVKEWLGKDYKKMELDDYVFGSGLLHAEALNEYVANYHRRMYGSSAAIFWMYNDSWPVTHGWTTVDYYMRKKLAYFPVKRAFNQVTLVVTAEGDKVNVYGVNETINEFKGQLQYGVYKNAGGYVMNETKEVSLPANASTVIASFDKATYEKAGYGKNGAFAVLNANGLPVAQYKLLMVPFKEMSFSKPNIKITQKDGYSVFTSDNFVWGVTLDFDGESNVADNCFDLIPGVPYYVKNKKGEKLSVLRTGNDLMLKK
jgi:beta-mannosidase